MPGRVGLQEEVIPQKLSARFLRDNAVLSYDDTELRVAIDVRDLYEATLGLWSELDTFAGRMVWKTVKGRDYLYHVFGNKGSGRSLGPRSAVTEAQYTAHRRGKEDTKQRLAETEPELRRAAAMYVAIGLPLIEPWVAKVLRRLDRLGLLGTQVLVVSDHAMAAYQIEAQQKIRLSMTSMGHDSVRALEVFTATGRAANLPGERLRPVVSPEQSWLLMGVPLRHVVCARNRVATALVVPDPRYFALHKASLSQDPKRDPLKAAEDARQAAMLWRALDSMPRYPRDEMFRASLPDPLTRLVDQLEAGA